MNVGGTVMSEASRGSQAVKLQEVLARARNISVYFKNWHISHICCYCGSMSRANFAASVVKIPLQLPIWPFQVTPFSVLESLM